MKVPLQDARANVRKEPAAHDAICLRDRPTTLLGNDGRARIRKLFREARKYRLGKFHSLWRWNHDGPWSGVHEQIVNVDVDAEFGYGSHCSSSPFSENCSLSLNQRNCKEGFPSSPLVPPRFSLDLLQGDASETDPIFQDQSAAIPFAIGPELLLASCSCTNSGAALSAISRRSCASSSAS